MLPELNRIDDGILSIGCMWWVMLILLVDFSFFFFFQAEDGIRDYKVTGVQTCALPICAFRLPAGRRGAPAAPAKSIRHVEDDRRAAHRRRRAPLEHPLHLRAPVVNAEIGRASCRERV